MGFLDTLLGVKRESRVEQNISTSFERVKQDISNIGKWISWLKQQIETLTSGQKATEDALAKQAERLGAEIEALKKENTSLKHHQGLMIEYLGALHSEVTELHKELNGLKSSQNQPITLDEGEDLPPTASTQELTSPPPILHAEGLTRAEAALLQLLYASPNPLSYREISAALGLSYGTIRNRLSRMREKGIALLFSTTPSGERAFFLPEAEKLRISGR